MPTPTAIVQLVSSPLCSIQCHTSCNGTEKIANHQIDNDPDGATFPCSRSTAGRSKATTGAADDSASEKGTEVESNSDGTSVKDDIQTAAAVLTKFSQEPRGEHRDKSDAEAGDKRQHPNHSTDEIVSCFSGASGAKKATADAAHDRASEKHIAECRDSNEASHAETQNTTNHQSNDDQTRSPSGGGKAAADPADDFIAGKNSEEESTSDDTSVESSTKMTATALAKSSKEPREEKRDKSDNDAGEQRQCSCHSNDATVSCSSSTSGTNKPAFDATDDSASEEAIAEDALRKKDREKSDVVMLPHDLVTVVKTKMNAEHVSNFKSSCTKLIGRGSALSGETFEEKAVSLLKGMHRKISKIGKKCFERCVIAKFSKSGHSVDGLPPESIKSIVLLLHKLAADTKIVQKDPFLIVCITRNCVHSVSQEQEFKRMLLSELKKYLAGLQPPHSFEEKPVPRNKKLTHSILRVASKAREYLIKMFQRTEAKLCHMTVRTHRKVGGEDLRASSSGRLKGWESVNLDLSLSSDERPTTLLVHPGLVASLKSRLSLEERSCRMSREQNIVLLTQLTAKAFIESDHNFSKAVHMLKSAFEDHNLAQLQDPSDLLRLAQNLNSDKPGLCVPQPAKADDSRDDSPQPNLSAGPAGDVTPVRDGSKLLEESHPRNSTTQKTGRHVILSAKAHDFSPLSHQSHVSLDTDIDLSSMPGGDCLADVFEEQNEMINSEDGLPVDDVIIFGPDFDGELQQFARNDHRVTDNFMTACLAFCACPAVLKQN